MSERPKIEISDRAFKLLQLETARRGEKQHLVASILIEDAVSDEVRMLVD